MPTHRCSLASLLTIALHGKLEYYTSIMKELLVDLIDASAAKNPKLMLRRTESVVEKMLTNWMSICMYSCLRVRQAWRRRRYAGTTVSQSSRGRLDSVCPPTNSPRRVIPSYVQRREGLRGGQGQARRIHDTDGDGGLASCKAQSPPGQSGRHVRELVLSHQTLTAMGALPALGERDVETH